MHQHHGPSLRTGFLGSLNTLEQTTTTERGQGQVGAHLSHQLFIGEVDQAARHQGLAQRLFNHQINVVTTAGEHHIGDGDVDGQGSFTAAQQRLLRQQFLFHQLALLQANCDLFRRLEGIGQTLRFGGATDPKGERQPAIRHGRCRLHVPGDLGEILTEALIALGQHRLQVNADDRVKRR